MRKRLYAEGTSGRKSRRVGVLGPLTARRKMYVMNLPRPGTAALVLVVLLTPSAAPASPASAALREKAAVQFYNLDRDEAMATFREAVAADPDDAAAYRGLASALWLSISYRRGNMTVDEYLGRVTKPNGPVAPAPPETVAAFKRALDKAITLARATINRNPRDADAHYQLGAAIGLRASYVATVEGSLGTAFRSAREAFNEHEEVLVLDPARKDAGLIVGTYRYIVATLSLPMRWMAYVVGFGGDKDRGLRLIQDAAGYSGDNREDARFALILLYNREKRYDDALKELAILRDRYPRNRLVWLESGATSLRSDRALDAERFLDEGIRRFADDRRPRMFGEDALWRYKRGAARAALGRQADAESDLRLSIQKEGRPWVHGRAHLELGKLALKAGHGEQANEELRAAVRLCESDNDPVFAEEARRLSK
jgi:tetratricopeptide (TPR) repeat protein